MKTILTILILGASLNAQQADPQAGATCCTIKPEPLTPASTWPEITVTKEAPGINNILCQSSDGRHGSTRAECDEIMRESITILPVGLPDGTTCRTVVECDQAMKKWAAPWSGEFTHTFTMPVTSTIPVELYNGPRHVASIDKDGHLKLMEGMTTDDLGAAISRAFTQMILDSRSIQQQNETNFNACMNLLNISNKALNSIAHIGEPKKK